MANKVHIATKLRLTEQQLDNTAEAVCASVTASLKRLGLPRVTVIQLHNSITKERGDQPTSITPRDVLVTGGVLDAFQKLKAEGVVEYFGLTGLGDEASLGTVIVGGGWTTLQLPVNILEPRRSENDLIAVCKQHEVAVIAIRVFAGGALTGQPASAHTRKTKFFSIDIYRRDQDKAGQLGGTLPPDISLKAASLRYVLGNPEISTALIGFANADQINEAVQISQAGPLSPEVQERLLA